MMVELLNGPMGDGLIALAAFIALIVVAVHAYRKASRVSESAPMSPEAEAERVGRMISPHEMSVTPPRAPVGKTVLVADDDPDMLHAMALRLRHLGLTVLQTPDAVQTLLGARRIHPDLAVFDVMMPTGNGLAIVEMLRSDKAQPVFPIVIHTARADVETVRRCEELGVIYVVKSATSCNKVVELAKELLKLEELPPAEAAAIGEAMSAESAEKQPDVIESSLLEEAPATSQAVTKMAVEERQAVRQRRRKKGQKPKILCIDELEYFKTIVPQLVKRRCDVVTTSRDHGYWSCFSENPDVILLGLAANDFLGRDILQRLHKHSQTRDIPIVIAAPESEIRAIRTDDAPLNQRYVTTPIVADQVVQAVQLEIDLAGIALDEEFPGMPASVAASIAAATAAEAQKAEAQAVGESNTETAGGEATPATSPEPGPSATEAPGEHRRPRILYIDDDADFSRAIALRLSPYGVEVVRAFNGMQGFWMGLDTRPDLIILDLKMPDGEGNYLFGRFQSHPLTQKTPVVVVTGNVNPGTRRQMLSIGVQAYLTKPLIFDDFLAVIRNYVPLKQPQSEAEPHRTSLVDTAPAPLPTVEVKAWLDSATSTGHPERTV